MKKLLAILCLAMAAPAAMAAVADLPKAMQPLDLPPEFLHFYYENAEGDFHLECTHQLQNDLTHDWDVVCGAETSTPKSFTVHFLVLKYAKTVAPKATYEVLYWIGTPDSQYTGTTFWISFNEDGGLYSFSVNQSVENDYARLWLDVSPKR